MQTSARAFLMEMSCHASDSTFIRKLRHINSKAYTINPDTFVSASIRALVLNSTFQRRSQCSIICQIEWGLTWRRLRMFIRTSLLLLLNRKKLIRITYQPQMLSSHHISPLLYVLLNFFSKPTNMWHVDYACNGKCEFIQGQKDLIRVPTTWLHKTTMKEEYNVMKNSESSQLVTKAASNSLTPALH